MLEGANFVPSLREYTARWGITPERLRRRAARHAPRPDEPRRRARRRASPTRDASLVVDQVRSGLVVRMAVLYDLLTAGPVAVESAVGVA